VRELLLVKASSRDNHERDTETAIIKNRKLRLVPNRAFFNTVIELPSLKKPRIKIMMLTRLPIIALSKIHTLEHSLAKPSIDRKLLHIAKFNTLLPLPILSQLTIDIELPSITKSRTLALMVARSSPRRLILLPTLT
jgi:hypothetical protein